MAERSEVWEARRKMRDHFIKAIEQAFLHTDSTSLVAEGIVWAWHDASLHVGEFHSRASLSEAWNRLDL